MFEQEFRARIKITQRGSFLFATFFNIHDIINLNLIQLGVKLLLLGSIII